MRIAITGGTGFIGRHTAARLIASGDEVVLLARTNGPQKPEGAGPKNSKFFSSDLSNIQELTRAFSGCEAVVHCAGINRELGSQTYECVHVQGTRNVCEAARRSGVRKIVLLSFLRARPDCGSPYHESKWAAEEIVRRSGLDFTVFKAGVVYGLGDHMLDHLSHALYTFPLFALVGMREKPMRPLAVEDLARAIEASLVDGRLSNKTIAIMGPEQMLLGEAVRRVGNVLGKKRLMFPVPLAFHYALAWFAERTMRIPLTAVAQVKILSEGIVEPLPACDSLPPDLLPPTPFTPDQIRKGLPPAGGFGLSDSLWFK